MHEVEGMKEILCHAVKIISMLVFLSTACLQDIVLTGISINNMYSFKMEKASLRLYNPHIKFELH